uniref:Acid-sensing ion channel 1 n=1 Tax=Parastrongyloides trichosuri TaxID=131310 RepID=A0A0N4Z4T4_PARTI
MYVLTPVQKGSVQQHISYPRRLVILLRDFSQWCTISGFNHIFGSSSIIITIFWFIVTAVCIYFGVVQSLDFVNAYLEYPVNTELLSKYEEITFPSITLCSRSVYKNNGKNEALNKILEAYNRKTDSEWGLVPMLEPYNVSFVYMTDFWLRIYANELLGDPSINLNISDIIDQCYYDHEKCTETNINTIKHPAYGTCYTINHEGNWKVARIGSEYGLKLTIKSDFNSLLPFYLSFGAAMFIHTSTEFPFIENNPIFLPPGNDVSVGLSIYETKRLPHPYGECIPNNNKKLEATENYYGGMYENEKCIRSCIQSKIIENCGCYYAGYAKKTDDNETLSCSEYIEKGKGKSDEIIYKVNITQDCNCFDVCDRTYYETSYSMGSFTAPNYTPNQCRASVIEQYKTNKIYAPYEYTQEACLNYFSENVVNLEIFFEKLNFIVQKEYAAYDIEQCINDIIGVLSFWIGISIISLFEVIILIYTIIVMLCCVPCCDSMKSVRTREIRKNIGDTNNDDLGDIRKGKPRRKDLYDQAQEADNKMPPIQEG